MYTWPQPQLMNEKKNHFLHDVEKLVLNYYNCHRQSFL